MKIFAINGSARKDGNTACLIRQAFSKPEAAGVETEMVQLAGTPLRGCTACRKCWELKNGKCILKGDPLNDLLEKMCQADAIILGSPTYFSDVTAEMKALIDRAGMVSRANGNPLRRKIGAGVVAVRRGGSMHALQTLQNFFLINEMIIPGSSYWNIGFGREAGEVTDDSEGIETMDRLGENLLWLLGKVAIK